MTATTQGTQGIHHQRSELLRERWFVAAAALGTPFWATGLWLVAYIIGAQLGAEGGDNTFGWLPFITLSNAAPLVLVGLVVALLSAFALGRAPVWLFVMSVVGVLLALLLAFVDFWYCGLSLVGEPEGYPATPVMTLALTACCLLAVAPAVLVSVPACRRAFWPARTAR